MYSNLSILQIFSRYISQKDTQGSAAVNSNLEFLPINFHHTNLLNTKL